MATAWGITESAVPPRFVSLHGPLGHKRGRPGDAKSQKGLVATALETGVNTTPGEIIAIADRWAGNVGWKALAYTPEEMGTTADGKPKWD